MYEEEARRFLVESAGRLNLLTPREVEDGLARAPGGIGGPIQWALREGVLTGRHPWRGGDLEEVGRLKLTEDPVPPDRVAANVPAGHAAVCLKMLARHPEARYPTVRFAQLDLVRLAQGETPHLSPPSWWDEAVAARAPAGENRTEAYEFLTGLWLEFLSIVRFVEDADAENEEIP